MVKTCSAYKVLKLNSIDKSVHCNHVICSIGFSAKASMHSRISFEKEGGNGSFKQRKEEIGEL